MKRILGLDLGTSSIGWALVNLEEEKLESPSVIKDFELVDGGVRIFKEMMDPKKGEPLNAARRSARSLRKLIDRKKKRLVKIVSILKALGLTKNSVQSILQKPLLPSVSPYQLRKKALDEKLTPEELIKVILHLAKRRGFRSSAKDQIKKKQDIEKLRQEIQQDKEKKQLSWEEYAQRFEKSEDEASIIKRILILEELFRASSYRTLGEFFYETYENIDFPQKIRGRFLDRGLLEKEFRLIMEKQSEFYPFLKEDKYDRNYQSFWGEDLRDIKTNIDLLYDAIFEPRPLKSQKHLIGSCPFFPKEKRALKSSLLFQEYALWAKINAIKIVREEEKLKKVSRDLTLEQKKTIVDLAESKKEISWKELRKAFQTNGFPLDEKEYFNFELSTGSQKEKFKGLTNKILLKESLKEHFESVSQEDKEGIIQSFSEGERQFYEMVDNLTKKYGWTPEEKEELKTIHFDNSNEYASYSARLLEMILPYLQEGVPTPNNEVSYKEWDILEYLKKQGRIPENKDLKNALLNDLEINQITHNPRVKKMLFELRKLLRSLMNKYGSEEVQKDWIFKIELAREMKKDEYNRNHQTQHQVFLQKLREEARSAEMKTREDEDRYILWRAQDEQCVYCQKTLKTSELNGTDTQIDHIIPISRIPDDSMDNKVLCCTDCNQEKGNRTPWEAFGNTPQWDRMFNYLTAITSKKAKAYKENKKSSDIPDDIKVLMNYSKFLRIQWDQEEIDKQREKFCTRQLNETRFGSTEAVKFIEHLRGVEERSIPRDRHILTTKGGFTNRVKQVLKIHTKEEIFTEEDWHNHRQPESLLAIQIVKEKPKEDKNNKKQRADHRHHFLDAFALTFIGPSFENRVTTIEKTEAEYKRLLQDIGMGEVQNLDDVEINKVMDAIEKNGKTEKQKNYWRRNFSRIQHLRENLVHKHHGKMGDYYQDIIQKIQEEIPKKLDTLIVSHAHNRKITGAFHEETVYGVLNVIPVSYLNESRIQKLSRDKYISKEVEKAIYAYIEKYKFLPTEMEEPKRKVADDPVLYALRRGKSRPEDKNGILPPPLELKEFWNEDQHGPYQKDKVPLLKPLYTKKAEPTSKNIDNVADVHFQKNLSEKLIIKEKIDEEEKYLTNQEKKKKKDFTQEEVEKCPTILSEIKKLEDSPEKYIQDMLLEAKETHIYDALIKTVKKQYEFKKVLMLDFASKKFIPESPQDSHKAFDTGNNHHMAVFERVKKDKKGNIEYKEDGTPQKERKGIIVTALDASCRARRKVKPFDEKDRVIYRLYKNYEPQYKILDDSAEWKFVMSLVAGDYIELQDNLLYKVYQMTVGEIHCSLITTSSKYDGSKTPRYILGRKEKDLIIVGKKGANSLLSQIVHKWYVNPIGELIRAND